MTIRMLESIIESLPTSDGAGVKLRRSLGGKRLLDPFLMLDEFSSDSPEDYIAGFPPHPHRGFETVTYMLDGHLRHEDHLGHVGELKSGGVQWMTAGRGIIHSEMPQQEQGRLRGFQLWINLPAREKMKEPSYRDIQPDEIPTVLWPGGGLVKIIAGRLTVGGVETIGPIQGLATEPLLLDVALDADAAFAQPVDGGKNAFVYPYEGRVRVGDAVLDSHRAGVLSAGESVELIAGHEGARFLLLAGRPLGEPVVQRGPFVMNTEAEIEQAIKDYQSGDLIRPPH
jgi:redox-sensitive bicupin YhaK (pirin superfamily)